MTAAVFQATFADFRIVKGRKVAQVVVEVPLEAADNALAMLGGLPQPDKDRWVAVARLNGSPGSPTPEVQRLASDRGDAAPTPTVERRGESGEQTKERRPFHTLPLPQQVALRCADPHFQAWCAPDDCPVWGEPETAIWVRQQCDVHSRAEIKPGSLAATAWKRLETAFLESTGQMPEARG